MDSSPQSKVLLASCVPKCHFRAHRRLVVVRISDLAYYFISLKRGNAAWGMVSQILCFFPYSEEGSDAKMSTVIKLVAIMVDSSPELVYRVLSQDLLKADLYRSVSKAV